VNSPENEPVEPGHMGSESDSLGSLDEGLTPTRPLSGLVVRRFLLVLVLLGQRVPLVFLGWVMLVGVATPAVVEVDRPWFVIGLLVLFFLLGSLLPDLSSAWTYQHQVVFGRPVFRAYGGAPERVIEVTIECAPDLWIDLPPRDAKDLAAFAVTTEDFVCAHTKNAYFRVQEERTGELPSQERWSQYWEEVTTQPIPIARNTYQRALADHPYAFALVPGWLARTTLLMPLPVIPLALVTLLSPLAIETRSMLPVMLAISTLFGLLGAVIAVAIGAARPGDRIRLDLPDFDAAVDGLTYLSEQERADLKTRAGALIGREVRIIDIRTGTRFKRAVARFLGRQFLVVLAGNLLFLVAAMGFCLAVAAPFSDDPAALAFRYGRQATLLALLVIAAFVAYRFWGFLIHRLGDIVGPPIGAAVAASIIPVGQYVTTGRFEFDVGTTIATAVAAAVGLYGTKLGEAAKRPNQALP